MVAGVWRVAVMRRRQMAMHVTFSPTRLSPHHLEGAYEMVVATIERPVIVDIPGTKSDVEIERCPNRRARR